MIKIIGTDHLMKKEEIEEIIKWENPDVIGTEFCNTRLNALILNPINQDEQKDETLIGKISSAIRKKAKEENVEYGSDMVTASRYAIENKIPLILLDRDVIEIKNLMEKIPVEEQSGFSQEIIKFQQEKLTDSKEMKPDDILNELKTKYPIAYEILISSRDLFIVNNILKAMLKFPKKKILIFIGKGHVDSITKQIKEGI